MGPREARAQTNHYRSRGVEDGELAPATQPAQLNLFDEGPEEGCSCRPIPGGATERMLALRIIAHDLCTPLSSLLLQAQLLERAIPLDDRNHARVERILASAHGLVATTRDLVDLSRIEAGPLPLEKRKLVPSAFVASLKQRLAPALGSSRLDVEIEPGLPEVFIDRDQLDAVLARLLTHLLGAPACGADVYLKARHAPAGVVLVIGSRSAVTPPLRTPLAVHLSALVLAGHGASLEEVMDPQGGRAFRMVLPR